MKSSSPNDTFPDCVLDVSPNAPIADNTPHITNARIEIYLTFNPDNFAASLFPPTAKKLLPVAVWAVKKYKMTATISIRITAIGIPAIFPKASFPNVSDKPEIGNPSE